MNTTHTNLPGRRSILPLALALALCGCATTNRDWEDARRNGTIEGYEKFLQTHPNADQLSEAQRRLQALRAAQSWAKAESVNTIAAYKEFLAKYPQSANAAQARTKVEALESHADWEQAQSLGTMASYSEFLRKHPTAKEALGAKKELERLETKRTMVGSFRVLSAKKSSKEPIQESLSFTGEPLSSKMTLTEDKGGMAAPPQGSVFVVVSWELSGFTAPKGFELPKDSLCLFHPDGTNIQPLAKAMWLTPNGGRWLSGASPSYEDGGTVTGTWLFVAPENAIDRMEIHFCERKVPLNAK